MLITLVDVCNVFNLRGINALSVQLRKHLKNSHEYTHLRVIVSNSQYKMLRYKISFLSYYFNLQKCIANPTEFQFVLQLLIQRSIIHIY